MDEALEKLAGRGTPRGFEHVLAGAAAAAERSADDPHAPVGDLDPTPLVSSEPRIGRRRPVRSLITAGGVAALVLVGAFAVSAVVGSGGSSSARGAVRQLAGAVSRQDPLAAAAEPRPR